MELIRRPYGHPDVIALTDDVQAHYRELYGGQGDISTMEDADFESPLGDFVVGYLDGVPVAMGGWRRLGNRPGLPSPHCAEIKRMYVAPSARGRGLSRIVLAELERSARAAGLDWLVLETGQPQTSAVRLYRSSGYREVDGSPYGHYVDEPDSVHLGRALSSAAQPFIDPSARPTPRNTPRLVAGAITGLSEVLPDCELEDILTHETLENLSHENRKFPPSAEFAAQANGKAELYDAAAADHEGFWAEQARSYLTWSKDFDKTLDWSDAPLAKWFVGGELNASYNCVDRHVEAGRGDKVAIHFVGEPGDTRDITYSDLLSEVQRAANALQNLGVAKGDRVAIYLPMIPEAVIAMLACARIGAPHSVIFGGFSADALRSRIGDAKAKVVVTADGGYRRGSAAALKPAVDDAVSGESTVEKVLVVKRTGTEVAWDDSRDVWWHEALASAAETHPVVGHDSEHPLFILYTSGTTGQPKGIAHTTGGYLTQCAYTNAVVHDVHRDTDVFWCTADVGWVTGHSYVVYGPLALGATQVLYEGTPDSPHQGRWWEIIEKYGVTIFYTAPTAIRTFMKWGREIPNKYNLSSLRVLGSVGEPINPEAWMWYREVIGADRCPIVDTWWQTETGAIMISPLPGVTATKPGSATIAVPGIAMDVVDDLGKSVPNGSGGYLVLTKPWPAMLRGIWGDPKRYGETYWSRFPGIYFAGDGAKKDEDGNIWLLGRVDDVMNISGHRLSTTEIESALVSHPKVAEAAVVGATDELTGQAVCAFVILRASSGDTGDGAALIAELRNHVAKEIGPIAKPRQIMIVNELPKTRSGKIMRRLLKDVAENREVGDVTTLADSSVMSLIKSGLSASSSE